MGKAIITLSDGKAIILPNPASIEIREGSRSFSLPTMPSDMRNLSRAFRMIKKRGV